MKENENEIKRIIDVIFFIAAVAGCLASLIVGAMNVADANNINNVAGSKIIDTGWYWVEIFLMPFIYAGAAFVLDIVIKRILFMKEKKSEKKVIDVKKEN